MKQEKKQCSVGECQYRELAKGLCSRHYFRLRKHGDVNIAKRLRGSGDSVEMRFWSRVALTANPDKCWLWLGAIESEGYGHVNVNGKEVGTHRYSFYLANGRWPEPQCLHKCDVRACVNPNHLWEGTQQENMHDMIAKGRQGWRKKHNSADQIDFQQDGFGLTIR